MKLTVVSSPSAEGIYFSYSNFIYHSFTILFIADVIVLYVMWLESMVIDVFVDVDGASILFQYFEFFIKRTQQEPLPHSADS